MKNLLDINQTQDFISFLIGEIGNYKEDWYIDHGEAKSLTNEIKKDISQLDFPFREPKLTFKTFFKALFFYEIYDEINSQELKLRMDNLKNDLKAIHIKIEKYRMDNNITDEEISK